MIGKSLEAKLTIYPNQQVNQLLTAVAADIPQLLIVSPDYFTIMPENTEAPENALVFDDVAILVEKQKVKHVIVAVKSVKMSEPMKNYHTYADVAHSLLKNSIQKQSQKGFE